MTKCLLHASLEESREAAVVAHELSLVLPPLFQKLEAIDALLFSSESILGILPTLQLVWPGDLVSKVDADSDRVLL